MCVVVGWIAIYMACIKVAINHELNDYKGTRFLYLVVSNQTPMITHKSTCANCLFFSPIESTNITLLDVNPISDDQIYIDYSKPTCIASYRLIVEGHYYNRQANFMKYQPTARNTTLRLSVTGFDFLGNDINTIYKVYYFGSKLINLIYYKL